MSNQSVSYCGWIGYNNIGDEAIYEATKQLIQSHNIIPNSVDTSPEATLLGGGTILPVALQDWSDYEIRRSTSIYALGVGVLDPGFYNRRVGTLDVRWLAGKCGIDLNQVWHDVGVLGSAVQRINGALGNPLNIQDYYFPPRSYYDIKRTGFERLGVRGPHSKEILSEYGVESTVVGDPALYLEPEKYHPETSNKIAVVVRDPDHHQHKNTKWTKGTEYIQEIISYCQEWSNEYDIVVLPFYPADIEVSYEIASQVPGAKVRDFTTYVELSNVMDEIASCDLVVGEKLHASILSAACHVPFISLEYEPKNADFVASVDLKEYNVRITNVTKDVLNTLSERALHNDELREKIRSEVADKRAKLENFASEIEYDISHPPE